MLFLAFEEDDFLPFFLATVAVTVMPGWPEVLRDCGRLVLGEASRLLRVAVFDEFLLSIRGGFAASCCFYLLAAKSWS